MKVLRAQGGLNMACPYCGCKVTYQYDNSEYLERCANCGKVFDVEMGLDDTD